MKTRNCTIIILVGCVQSGYGMEAEPLRIESVPKNPFEIRDPLPRQVRPHSPEREDHKPPLEIRSGGHRSGQVAPKPPKPPQDPIVFYPSHPGIGQGTSSGLRTFEGHSSSNQEVSAYLEQKNGNLARLAKMFEGISLDAVAHARARYLETMEQFFQQGIVSEAPFSLARSFSVTTADKSMSSFLPWMVFLTDSFSFVEQLSHLPSVTQVERMQYQLSPAARTFSDTARTTLIESSQQFLALLRDLVSSYPHLFSGAGKLAVHPEDELIALSITLQEIDDALHTLLEQRDTYIAWLCKESPQAQEIFLGTMMDQSAGVKAWKEQEHFEDKKLSVLFPSFKSFMRGFSLFDVKRSVEKYVGKGPEQIASVQDLVTALDQIAFIIEEKSSLISSFQSYSADSVAKVLKAITEAYPDTFIPSKRFIFQYCTLHRTFKPVSFFIPNIRQFLIDAQNLTIEELAEKYGHGREMIQGLLDTVYGAVYVLQQTNQTNRAMQLKAILRKIMLLYPSLTPTILTEMVALKSVPLQLIFNSQAGLVEIMSNAQRELLQIKQQKLKTSLSNLSVAVNAAVIQLNVSELRGTLAAARQNVLGGARSTLGLKRSLKEVVKELKGIEDVFALGPNSLLLEKQFSLLRSDAMKLGLDVAYERAKERQNQLGNQLIRMMMRDFTTSHFLMQKLPPLWDAFFIDQQNALASLNNWMAGANELVSEADEDMNNLVAQMALKGALEKENESDFQACIWASNKMGIMESKVKCMASLIKIKTTPLFILGYKSALKDLKADLEFLYSSRRVQKCLNVIARRIFLSEEISGLEAQIAQIEKKQRDGDVPKAHQDEDTD